MVVALRKNVFSKTRTVLKVFEWKYGEVEEGAEPTARLKAGRFTAYLSLSC